MFIWYKISPEKKSQTMGLLKELAMTAPELTDRILNNMGSQEEGTCTEVVHLLHIKQKYLEEISSILTDGPTMEKYGILESGTVSGGWLIRWPKV